MIKFPRIWAINVSRIFFLLKFDSSLLSDLSFLWWICSYFSNTMDRCNYLVPGTNWMVEMPMSSGQYHHTIASLWISHLVHNLSLSPVMTSHIAAAQLSNPRQLLNQTGIIIIQQNT